MIELRPVDNYDTIKAYFEKNSLEINEFSGCVSAKCGSDVLGYCLYDMTENQIIIRLTVPSGDIMLADGILRSTLHVAAQRNIIDAVYAESADEALFEKLGFIKDKEKKQLNINKLFESCGNCGK